MAILLNLANCLLPFLLQMLVCLKNLASVRLLGPSDTEPVALQWPQSSICPAFHTTPDWNNMLMNKTAIECWNILKYEIETIIDKFVPLKKQGKRSRKKHLSKEAIRK